jgi:hypothetical protein
VVRRQLQQASRDPRYGYGETVLTVWPPPEGFAGINALTRILSVDDNGDGRKDRRVTIPMPVFHALNLLSDLGERYWTLAEHTVGGHVVGGFASRDDAGVVRVVLSAHHPQDTQSRSEAEFDVTLELAGLGWSGAQVREYRFDRDHNSYYRPGRELRDQAEARQADHARLAAALQALGGDDPASQRDALRMLGNLGPTARSTLPAVLGLLDKTRDESVRAAARSAVGQLSAAPAYPTAEVERVRELAECRPTAPALHSPATAAGNLRLTARVAGNGLNILVVEEDQP